MPCSCEWREFLILEQTVVILTQTVTTWSWAINTVKFHRCRNRHSRFMLFYRSSVFQHSHLIPVCNRTTRSTGISKENKKEIVIKEIVEGDESIARNIKIPTGKIRFHKKIMLSPKFYAIKCFVFETLFALIKAIFHLLSLTFEIKFLAKTVIFRQIKAKTSCLKSMWFS